MIFFVRMVLLGSLGRVRSGRVWSGVVGLGLVGLRFVWLGLGLSGVIFSEVAWSEVAFSEVGFSEVVCSEVLFMLSVRVIVSDFVASEPNFGFTGLSGAFSEIVSSSMFSSSLDSIFRLLFLNYYFLNFLDFSLFSRKHFPIFYLGFQFQL